MIQHKTGTRITPLDSVIAVHSWTQRPSTSMSSAGEASRLNVEFQLIPETLVDPFRSDFFNYADGLVRGTPGGFVLSPEYGKTADLIYNFPLREDDTWVVTFPKCGKQKSFEVECYFC